MPVTIDRVTCYDVKVPLRRPLADAVYYRTHWHIPVVEVRTSDGLVGTGYSGVWAGEELILDAITHYLAEVVIGQDPSQIGSLWRAMYWSPLHWVGRAGVAHMALGMIDTALWDIAAQRAGLPLWKLLGGSHATIDTYNTDGGWLNFSLDELLADMTAMVDAGWARVKMKVGASPESDLERVRAVRAALPSDVELMVDVNQRWDRRCALRMLHPLNELGIGWVEEPLHPDDIAGHAALTNQAVMPIALGENIYSQEHFAAFFAAHAVDIVQVDVTRVGGVTEWLRIAHLAQGLGLPVIPHAGDMMQVHQHLVGGAGSELPRLIEYLPWGLEVFAEPVQVNRGLLTLPQSPGASSRIDPVARARWASSVCEVGGSA